MSKLTIVGTPLGNIEDISLRAIRNLFETDIVLAEDTRVFLKLKSILKERYSDVLQVLKVQENRAELVSYRDQNHDRIISNILGYLKEDKKVVLTTDAGMPAISDPGYKLVRDVTSAGFEIDVIPGPTAIDTSLVISGLPTDKFVFLGFPPRTKSKIIKLLKTSNFQLTTVLYESPFRVIKLLEVVQEAFGEEVEVAAVNDLTKKFEKVFRGKVGEVIGELKKIKVQGEWVIVLRNKE